MEITISESSRLINVIYKSLFLDVDQVRGIVKRHYLFNRMTCCGFMILGFGLVIALLLFSPMEDGLPIGARYPFNTTIPPWHAIALTIEVFAVSGGVLAILSTDSIMVLISNIIIMQFDVLNVNFESCGRQAVKDVRKERVPKCKLLKISIYLFTIID